MAALNKVMLIGNLGQNPELRYTQAGLAVATLSVATNETWTDKEGKKQEKVEWHRVIVWGKLAENCNQYLEKGRPVYVEGKLQTRQWQDKDGQTKYTTEIQALAIQFLGSGQGQGVRPPHPADEQGAPQGATQGGTQAGGQNPPQQFTSDDIPF